MNGIHSRDGSPHGISRRAFVGTLAAGMAALRAARTDASARYRVARIQSADPYNGTTAALTASGEFPDVVGRTVVIKPNLVARRTAETGVTTHPEAVRAIVDWALAAGAAAVTVVEGGKRGANFTSCGYDVFQTYDPRVRLLDLSTEPLALAPAPPAPPPPGTPGAPAAFRAIYLPSMLLAPDVVFVSVAKLKTHAESMATLTIKNLFGLPACPPYFDPTQENALPRFLLHDRGLGQAISDVVRARSIDFAVVEGVWGLEGDGPIDLGGGIPVPANVLAAGKNALAVDLACLDMIGIAPDSVQHLEYAFLNGLGPSGMSQIDLVGDAVAIAPFARPVVPPKIWYPRISPVAIAPGAGERTTISYRLMEDAQVQVQVLRTSDRVPAQISVRTLQAWTDEPAGSYRLEWDGRDDAGQVVAPSVYGVRVQARRPSDRAAAAINWVVTA